MGNCMSGAPSQLLESADGGEEAYHKRFLEDAVLGEGEFGVVKLVHDMTAAANRQQQHANNGSNTAVTAAQAQPMACKVLRKGVVFKDNVLYSPLKPEILRGEIEMLRVLAGECYCLKLEAVYESAKCLFVITEYCAGGELEEYVAKQESVFSTEDVSRIAYQLLSAVNHCAQHDILHRDIKPGNIMFANPGPGAAIRLIDFGSGTMDRNKAVDESVVMINGLRLHKTFAGSAFYISPEMFQRNYTALTDVWSVGVTLYVLVAGYPADALQKAFNVLQTAKNRDLRKLPNMPDNLPDSFYDLLQGCLTYRYKERPTAERLLQHEFVTFHLGRDDDDDNDVVPELSLEQVSAAAASAASTDFADGSVSKRRASVSLAGSVVRHNLFLGFKKFERAVTTLLAAMLSKAELEQLLAFLESRVDQATMPKSDETKDEPKNGDKQKEQQLGVVQVSELKNILLDDLKNAQVLETMAKIPNAELYDSFAYHTALLSDFARIRGTGNAASLSASLRRGQRGGGSRRGGNLFGDAATQQMTGSNSSLRSTSSLRSFSKRNGSRNGRNSVHGTNVFKNMASKKEARSPSIGG